jgi:hypothetical protein
VSWPKWSIADVMSARPEVRVNQLGYLPDRPMRATLISSAELPVPFTVRDIAGATMFVGASQPWPVRPEPSSGLSVHLLDFTGLAARGTGFWISAGDQRSHPFAVADGLYSSLCGNALRVLYLLRSGMPLADDITPGYGRPAGHVGRPPNRGDIEVPAWTGPDADRLYPDWRGEGSFDVSGGWYDAGDYGKYVTSGAIALWQLMSTLGWLRTIGRTELAAAMDDECRWQLDWLLRMQVPPASSTPGWRFIGCMARSGHRCPAGRTRIRPDACCIGRRRPRRCTWPPSPPKVRACSGPPTGAMPTTCYGPLARHTKPRSVIPGCLHPTTTVDSVAARTPTRIPPTTSTGRLRSSG